MCIFKRRRRTTSETQSALAAPSPTATPSASSSPIAYITPETAPKWLAAVANAPEVAAYKRTGYEFLEPQSGWRVLDVGCGIGDDVRALALMVAPGGAVTGIDVSPAMIEAAQERQAAGGESPVPISFLAARAEQLPFERDSFDAARADRMLQHAQNPAAVVAEMKRVLRTGGRIVIIEPDWRSITIYPSSPDPHGDRVAEAILAWHIAHTPQPTIGRRLRALLTESGFGDVEIRPVAYPILRFQLADLVFELTAALERLMRGEAPGLAPDIGHAWLDAVQNADAAGTFFASVCYFYARGIKP